MKQKYVVIFNVDEEYTLRFRCTSPKEIFNVLKTVEVHKLDTIKNCTLEIRIYENPNCDYLPDNIDTLMKEFKYFKWED